jgi:hypothetical protein
MEWRHSKSCGMAFAKSKGASKLTNEVMTMMTAKVENNSNAINAGDFNFDFDFFLDPTLETMKEPFSTRLNTDPRLPIAIDCYIKRPAAPDSTLMVKTFNVSRYGACITSPVFMDKDERVVLHTHAFSAEAQVRHVRWGFNEDNEFVCFVGLSIDRVNGRWIVNKES